MLRSSLYCLIKYIGATQPEHYLGPWYGWPERSNTDLRPQQIFEYIIGCQKLILHQSNGTIAGITRQAADFIKIMIMLDTWIYVFTKLGVTNSTASTLI